MEPHAPDAILRSRRVLHGGQVGPADVVVRSDRIVAVTPHDMAGSTAAGHDSSAIADLGDRLVSPGLIDTQINGAGSVDLRQQPAALDALCAIAARHGVTTVVATLPSHDLDAATIDRLADAADAIARRRDDPTHADTAPIAAVAGIHLEGPYLAPARAGAHRLDDLRPIDADTIAVWAADPRIVMMTLAPELPGALDAIRVLAAGGTCVAIGHTDAGLDVVAAAVDAGARHVTHLWNAMAGLHHRAPGLPGAVLTDSSLTAGLICDGAHVDPLVVRLTWQALGSQRLVLVSDAVVGAGGERHGTSSIAGGAAAVGTDGTLYGSLTMLDEGVRNLIEFTGAPLADALATATRNPARLLGRADLGIIAAGARADVVVFDDDLVPAHVMVGGRWVVDHGVTAPTAR